MNRISPARDLLQADSHALILSESWLVFEQAAELPRPNSVTRHQKLRNSERGAWVASMCGLLKPGQRCKGRQTKNSGNVADEDAPRHTITVMGWPKVSVNNSRLFVALSAVLLCFVTTNTQAQNLNAALEVSNAPPFCEHAALVAQAHGPVWLASVGAFGNSAQSIANPPDGSVGNSLAACAHLSSLAEEAALFAIYTEPQPVQVGNEPAQVEPSLADVSAHPELGDYAALLEGRAALAAGEYADAASAFGRAIDTIDSDISVLARVGRVRAFLQGGHPRAPRELTSLEARYPELPQTPWLRLELARYHERDERLLAAIRNYRNVEVEFPRTNAATESMEALSELESRGVHVPPRTSEQTLRRAERLFARGPLDAVPALVDSLLEGPIAQGPMAPRLHALAADVRRHTGDFAAALEHYEQIEALGGYGDEDATSRRSNRAASIRQALETQAQAETQLQRLQGRRRLAQLPTARVFSMATIAARAGLTEPLNTLVDALKSRDLAPALRIDLVTHALSIADSEGLRELLSAEDIPGQRGVVARYYDGRLAELAGDLETAEARYVEVSEADRSELTYYAMWAEGRLRGVREALLGECESCDTAEEVDEARRTDFGESPVVRETTKTETSTLIESLESLASNHGEAYPWIQRAAAFLSLGQADEAGRQLYETYLAWREASGRAVRRTGLESVALGRDRPVVRVTPQIRRARVALTESDRRALSEVADALGATGAATGFGGHQAVLERPRAHEAIIVEVAERYEIDPNLLFAVMRVESVYQPRVVSYAGAIGLSQIMPRTGALIASALGRRDFQTSELLDPKVNLEFSAWYLRSLIDRFDGHLPLALASYNGGPHNVRTWLKHVNPDLPLDAFLEHIPFTQTHRYVRRVLGHYEAYRLQEELPMIRLSTRTPEVSIDPVGF